MTANPERRALVTLTKAVKHCVSAIDAEMKQPPSPDRGSRIAKITNALELSNDIALRFGLGKRRISDGQD